MSKARQGELLILLGALLWGSFPVLVVLTYSKIGPISSLAYATVFALLFFVVVVTLRKKWKDLLDIEALKAAILSAVFLGILLFTFFYIGLTSTSPGNASLLAQIEVFFSFLFFHLWKKDAVTLPIVSGALLMVGGALLVLLPNFSHFNPGDFFIILAVACTPFGNYFSKKARLRISSEAILLVRSLIALPCIFILAYTFEQVPTWTATQSLLPLLALIGIMLLGVHKIMWIEGIHRIPVAKAVSLASLTPLVSLLLSWVILGTPPSFFQLASFFPIVLGVYLLTSHENPGSLATSKS